MKTQGPNRARLPTGVRNLDLLLQGGLPMGTLTVVAGPPGSGKTILAQQIGFAAAAAGQKVLYFQTLSEPTAKTLLYLSAFSYFDPKLLESQVTFVDLGALLRSKGLEQAAALVMEHVQRIAPAIVVIDSFKVFDDLATSAEGLRKFSYEIAVGLMAWQCTTLLLGEYTPSDYETNPLFSITDGLVHMFQEERSGEHQRFLRITKMRGTAHDRDAHPFQISAEGIEVFTPRIAITRAAASDVAVRATPRCKTGIANLDALLGDGIPRGSTVLVGGAAGTGKTALLLEFIYRGASEQGEKGIIFSFEETEERLLATARGFGWDLEAEVTAGRVEIVFIPQPEIVIERHLMMMRDRVVAMGARRVAIDSASVFLYKVNDTRFIREKVFQLASLVQNAGAVGFFATDVPYGSNQISRSGVEETVVDGVILLSSSEERLERHRYIEVYKLRNTAHAKGRHSLMIGPGGLHVFPRLSTIATLGEPPPPVDVTKRLSTGIPALDALLGGGLLERSVTLVSGSAGSGKTTLALQFLVEGATRSEPGLYVALEEGPEQLLASADALGIPLRTHVERGAIEIVYLSADRVRDAQLLALLTEKIVARHVKRLVLDSASHLVREPHDDDPLPQLLADLVVRFKRLGASSLFTLEAKSLYSSEAVTDHGLSPIADNLVLLRYADLDGVLSPTLVVVKTRGSARHGTWHKVTIGPGGMTLGAAVRPNDSRQEGRGT